jgi:hypothetical protein
MATNTLSKRPAEDTAFFTFLAALPQSSCTLAHFLAASKDIYIRVSFQITLTRQPTRRSS